MALSTLYKTRIAGVASAVPKEIISNSDYTVISPEQREKMATILHRAYGSVDLAQKIRAMSARGPVGPIISR